MTTFVIATAFIVEIVLVCAICRTFAMMDAAAPFPIFSQ